MPGCGSGRTASRSSPVRSSWARAPSPRSAKWRRRSSMSRPRGCASSPAIPPQRRMRAIPPAANRSRMAAPRSATPPRRRGPSCLTSPRSASASRWRASGSMTAPSARPMGAASPTRHWPPPTRWHARRPAVWRRSRRQRIAWSAPPSPASTSRPRSWARQSMCRTCACRTCCSGGSCARRAMPRRCARSISTLSGRCLASSRWCGMAASSVWSRCARSRRSRPAPRCNGRRPGICRPVCPIPPGCMQR